jgi:hypothetical protein
MVLPGAWQESLCLTAKKTVSIKESSHTCRGEVLSHSPRTPDGASGGDHAVGSQLVGSKRCGCARSPIRHRPSTPADGSLPMCLIYQYWRRGASLQWLLTVAFASPVASMAIVAGVAAATRLPRMRRTVSSSLRATSLSRDRVRNRYRSGSTLERTTDKT